jgi:predicted nucleotidyltransferase
MRGLFKAPVMLNPDFRDILSAFNAERVEYLLVGAYALAAHGLPRATGDIDLWIRPSASNAQCVRRALDRFGAPRLGISLPDLETPDLVVQLGLPPRRIDLMTSIDGIVFETAWRERVTISVEGIEVPTISRENLITNKRATGRPQDLADVARLTNPQG